MYDLQDLLNVTTDTMKAASRFKAHILKKSVEEINAVTDIHLTCDLIKKGSGVYIVHIKSRQQDNARLQELGLKDEDIDKNKFYTRSKEKLEIRKNRGQEIFDAEAWIREDLKKMHIFTKQWIV